MELVGVPWFERRLAAMVDDLGELVSCESPATDPAALAHSAAVLAEQGRRLLGAAPESLVVSGRTHLRWKFGHGQAKVLLVGHHDTVWPVGTLRELPWAVTDGIATGPGCFDMKAGLVLIFHALASLDDLDGITVFVSGDEELGSPTARDLLAESGRGCAAALVTEPSADGGALKTARKGIAQYEISVSGRAAHAGLEPERGVNATTEIARQVLAVAELAAPGTSVTPTVLAAGQTANTVPSAATLSVDSRAPTLAEQRRVHEALRSLTAHLPGARVRVRELMSAPPLEPSASAWLFELAGQVCADLGTSPPRGTSVGGGSDGNHLAAQGVPTLDGLGAVGGNAHAVDEHVIVAELPGRAALLAGLINAVRAATPVTEED
ncbi:M20 family metallopeptidase [Amycolatopsis sp. CA-230715]|uniref:M20 family metallopeptidase n=1 Tax=Amycolatopsis sp. CA-230715 TaxID=2745196 RepID=UPI001C034F05|nr:M20 family metallopeptidase [Amycolatopsis sp. CA-230715]QWF83536.1 Carboxypeptidase G2 [Amycolatopsis sp. CA-230715]